MGSNTEDVIDRFFNMLLQRFQHAQETSHDRGSKFIPDIVEWLYYHFQRIVIRRAESYIITPDWIASKKATINQKNEKDNKCFQWSIISELNYAKINEKELKKILKFKELIQIFYHTKKNGKNLNKTILHLFLQITVKK